MTTSKTGRASFFSSTGAFNTAPLSLTYGENQNFGLTTSSENPTAYTVADPAYLSVQLTSTEWLRRYGLKSQKLTFDQILQQIGVKRVESSNGSTDKGRSAKFAGSLYQEIKNDNGDRYILTCRPEKLREFRNRLSRMLSLLQKRLAFLTSGSRRLFGVIGEPSACLVCDCKTTDQRVFNQVQLAITTLIKEQISKLKRFNIIWVTNDNELFQEQPIDVTTITIEQALEWIARRKCSRNTISVSATCEAVLKALTNPVHCIYLISEGSSSDSAREMLRDNIVKTRLSSNTPLPIHVVSLFPPNNDTEIYLRSIAQTAHGSYYSYKLRTEMSDFKSSTNLINPTQMKLQNNGIQYGKNTLTLFNSENSTDMSLMYKEINECQNIIDRLDKILGTIKDENNRNSQTTDTSQPLDAFDTSNRLTNSETNLQRSLIVQSSALFHNDENNMASIDWLKIYGVNAQKLDFYSVLQSAAHTHCDAVANLSEPTKDTGSATLKDRIYTSKFCDQFAHVTWTDGTIRHVYVTPELHRDYERRMRALIEKMKARLLWLKKGSRDVFGTILEKNIYILIDTSQSMENHINLLRDKLRLLIQEQLFSKEKVNIVSFNTSINPWRDSLTRISSSSTQNQLKGWIDNLHAEGSTNTLGALRFALADSGTEAIYLLTDGRPDQNERYILSQVQYRQITPIHTIAFNCQDQTANQFLFDLSRSTGGRFHAFNFGLDDQSSIEMPESEDISYLKKEIAYAEKDLQRVADLRDESMSRTWSHENIQNNYKSIQTNGLSVLSQPTTYNIRDLPSRVNSSLMPQTTANNKRSSKSSNRKQRSKSAAPLFEPRKTFVPNSDHWILPSQEEHVVSNGRTDNGETNAMTTESEDEEQVTTVKKTLSPYNQVKVYLQKNSLVAKRLTILDVLKPTSITIKNPERLQVIDRYVLAKVWDDILPFTYGSYVDKFRFVNHYAVDLEKYENKLRNLIAEYHLFTTNFIWKCLSDDDKRDLGPSIYWITLSKEEQNRYSREITNDDNINERSVELFAWRQLTPDEQKKLLQKAPLYSEKTEEVLKTALGKAKAKSALQGVARMDVEIKRAIKFLQISNDLRKYQKPSPGEQPPVSSKRSADSRVVRLKFVIGLQVLYPYDGDGYFYPGRIQKNRNGIYIILFDMGIEQEIHGYGQDLIKYNFMTQSSFFIQDYVLVRQERDREEYWVPGFVVSLPSRHGIPTHLYKVQIHDPLPKYVDVDRQDIILINFNLFQRSVLYIQHIHLSTISGRIIINPPVQPSKQKIDLEKLLREHIGPLVQRIDYISILNDERFYELQIRLEVIIAAIRALQDQADKQPSPSPSPSTSSRSTPPPLTPSIKPGTHVYALWLDDDALVYEGTVLKSIDVYYYQVERIDLRGVISNIHRQDIFLDGDLCLLKDIATKGFALIKYPNDSRNCYFPALVLRKRHQENKIKVRFYDCYEDDINSNEYVIPINEKQFERYSTIRIEKEKSLVGQVIVGFYYERRVFMLGTIKERIETGHKYEIEWHDGSRSQQTEEHLFGAFVRRDRHYINSYILAMDINDKIYRLARTKAISDDRKTLTVEFIVSYGTGETSSPTTVDVSATTTFVITEAYFNKIIHRIERIPRPLLPVPVPRSIPYPAHPSSAYAEVHVTVEHK